MFRKYFVKHQERNEETESLRIVGQGGIVIGSSLKFQNSKIEKLIRKNGACKKTKETMQAMMAVSSQNQTIKAEPFSGKQEDFPKWLIKQKQHFIMADMGHILDKSFSTKLPSSFFKGRFLQQNSQARETSVRWTAVYP